MPAAAAGTNESEDIAALGRVAAGCELCRLCDTRTHVVFGAGRAPAELMLVADAPGWQEDRTGQAFAGEAGALVDDLLAEIGLSRDHVWLTHVVKCRPPRNRSPFPDEVEQCEGYLFRQVAMVRPRVICPFGNVPLRLLTGRPLQVSEAHGRALRLPIGGRDTIIYPLFHPGAAASSDELQAVLRREFRAIPRLLRGERPRPESPVSELRAAIAERTAEGQLPLDIGER